MKVLGEPSLNCMSLMIAYTVQQTLSQSERHSHHFSTGGAASAAGAYGWV